jgi:hypothetical protein
MNVHNKNKEIELLNVICKLHKLYKKRFPVKSMKRGLLTAFTFLISIGFISAQGTISDLLNSIDETTLILYAVFLISFTLLFFSLNRVFKDNRTTSGIISVVIALLIVYGVNKSGLNIQGVFSDIGISQDILMTIVPIIILLGAILVVIKLKLNSLFVFGALLIFASLFVYEQSLLLVLGLVLIGLWFFISLATKKKEK